jgi:mono/diheme cytochrome c family protein
MRASFAFLFLAAALLCLLGCEGTSPPAAAPAADKPPARQSRSFGTVARPADLALGKQLFVERCSRCHGESGEKPFGGGPSFNERAVPAEEITRAVNGRFRDKSDDERHAVIRYLQSITKPVPDPPRHPD